MCKKEYNPTIGFKKIKYSSTIILSNIGIIDMIISLSNIRGI